MDTQVEIMKAIQSVSSPALDFVAEAVTWLGEQYFALAVLLFLYWCCDKRLGRWAIYSTLAGALLSNSVKILVKKERPIGYPGIRSLHTETATGYSFPSGHTTQAGSLYTGIALWFGRAGYIVAALVLTALVALSRLYLGCHWPNDVVAGFLIGTVLTVILYKIFQKFENRFPVLFAVTSAIFVPFLLVTGDVADFWKVFGLAAGASAAFFLEERYTRFETEGLTAKRRILRMLTGFAVTGAIFIVLKLVLPEGNLFYFIRYSAVAVGCLFLAPLAFVRLKI